ncbi:aldehyde dehydrogenase family protein [Peredibacter starrii]|uniref:Aldehyde dehydrogenase family protein n=1 Tax=Peredibacter starrii TaxID=28202 RepID=A0AAX4HSH1_9BACT|nr:aldehyde dehydrogenase family protein [Peredibacter starrii]WPU66289.1 aldehyde dehydrogenase family protein [Peredibacter starrii]
MKEIKLFINGDFRTSEKSFTSLNPANGETVAKVYLPSHKDIDQAVDAAENAFYSLEWRGMDQNKRAEILEKISEKLKERRNELVELEVADSGSSLRKAKADVANAASYFKVLAGQLRKFQFEVKDENASRAGFSHNYRVYEPVGVCAQIIPWNFPLVMAAWKIGPVIASGSTSVLKTAEDTPVTASILAEILNDAGLPKGVVNIITGGASEGEYLLANKKVKKVAFTGSTAVGRKIMQNAGERIQNLSLELGGKSANIVLDDADLSIAVDGALYAFLYHAGQACDSGTRLFVEEKIYPEFKEALVKRIKDVKVGLPTDPATAYGPVVNKKQLDTIMGYIETSKKEGAKLLAGGSRMTDGDFSKGYYIQPTLFEVTPDHTIFNEEIFGPVLAITPVKNETEAVKLANQSVYGLAGAVWSKNQQRAINVAKQLETGMVWINEYHLLNPGMPFGGYKQSGIGREMGEEGMKAYLEVKHLWISDCDERAKKPWFDAIF